MPRNPKDNADSPKNYKMKDKSKKKKKAEESGSDSDSSADSEASKASYRKIRNKKRRENVARYIMEQGAIRVIENICK